MSAAEHEMTMEPIGLAELARLGGLTHAGPDREIAAFGGFNTTAPSTDRMLGFLADPSLAHLMDELDFAACVVNESLAGELDGLSMLVTDGDAIEAFYSLFIQTVEAGRWGVLESRQGSGNEIAGSAVVHDGVQIGDDCVLMDSVVLMPNTRLGDRVTIQPNTTVGGDGFQVATIEGSQRMVPHCGGVWLGDDVHIGSSTCIDRGQFGEFTQVGDGTKIDNLIHIAHSVRLGAGGVVAASTEIGGITAGDGFWIAPQCCVLNGADLGEHSYVGIGSVVVRPVPPHGLAYGSPARRKGWVCTCRTKLDFSDGRAECSRCGRTWAEAENEDSISELTA